ncbi:helix-turn-helix domain-containing protein [Mycobacterium sp. 236(2023)]|uniref:PucR family transcriptional regulator n=1 Tax=Mycobacterium sp. 236(2023) TaxID=3038163 RepID=UPI0024156E01|nr:helix-turn-helix domain-containing protein [Mycobacterium sp. 236(2023)]MDG4667219.1 helix-turn-helix domain-containing protein [Mycobacterium sp. 236(2023)]
MPPEIASSVTPALHSSADARDQLSNLYGVLVLSALMFDGRDAVSILELAANAVPSLGAFHTDATYRMLNGTLVDGRDPDRKLESDIDALVIAASGADSTIDLHDGQWRRAIALQAVEGSKGALVIRAEVAPSDYDLFLLRALAQQTAAAMTSADLLGTQRALIEERQRAIIQLSDTISELRRQDRIHATLTAVSGSGAGVQGIADSLKELTTLDVVVEDVFGNTRAWSGAVEPDTHVPRGGNYREELFRRTGASGTPQREGHRIFWIVRQNANILGAVSLHDPTNHADRLDIVALEHAATALALEFAHLRVLAETELRLRRDLIEDLLAGTDDSSAYMRAEALDHNLRVPHTVAVLQWRDGIPGDVIVAAAQRFAVKAGMHSLAARKPTMTVLLTDGTPDPAELYRAIAAQVGSEQGAIGIGSTVTAPSDLPRSFAEAQRALQVQTGSMSPYGGRRFGDLGLYRILDHTGDSPEVRAFVMEWLGPLLNYDREKRADLVVTLTQYLDCGGNYDATAKSLTIHRSTLRYRLGRIRDILGRDLQDVEDRLNLHLATRIVRVTGAPLPEEKGH